VEENKETKEIWKLFKDLNPKKQNNFPPSMKFENETCRIYENDFVFSVTTSDTAILIMLSKKTKID
jgi:hypothetical protein